MLQNIFLDSPSCEKARSFWDIKVKHLTRIAYFGVKKKNPGDCNNEVILWNCRRKINFINVSQPN